MTSLVWLFATPIRAQTPCEAPAGSAFHMDFEVDPTAYVLAGHSLHVGLGYGRFRLDLGNFAMAVPQFVHGDDGFDVSFNGYGVKLQYFFEEQTGLFAGIDGGLSRMLAERQGSALSAHDTQVSLGVNVGYRIAIAHGLYITPWIGLGYSFGAGDVTLAGATYEAHPITVFPAIHLGYRAL